MTVTTIYATEHHAYALPQQAARTAACYCDAGIEEGEVIIVTDNSKTTKKGVKAYHEAMPAGIKVTHIQIENNTPLDFKYDNNPALLLLIARLQHVAWTAARKLRPDYIWSLESDVMPPANALTCMIDCLRFDRSRVYDVAICTYGNQGFVGGRTVPGHWIAPDVYDDEREITDELKAEQVAREESIKLLNQENKQPTEDQVKVWRELDEKVKQCPQKGNVHTLNGIRYRRRGWLEAAYPGVGWGAFVPTDWVVLGCTLMSPIAFNSAHFEGYQGQGTQDLWIGNNCWQKLKKAVIPHCLCHHIKRQKDDPQKIDVLFARHEQDGEFENHPRVAPTPWKEIV